MSRAEEGLTGASPIRRLWSAITDLDSVDAVHDNLCMGDADYSRMVGPPEHRFCEWAYDCLSKRKLVSGLLGTVLRPSDARTLAVHLGRSEDELVGLGPSAILRESLESIGVYEPRIPSPQRDGLEELERCRRTLDEIINGTGLPAVAGAHEHGLSPALALARRAAERLLKVLCFFAWDNGLDVLIRETVTNGLHGFQATVVEGDKWERWLHRGDLGQFNYLLQALDKGLAVNDQKARFLPADRSLWPKAAHAAFDALAAALQTAVHDTQTTPRFEDDPMRLLHRQHQAIENVVSKATAVNAVIWRPRTVCFFRRIDDGHAVHHEGYNEDGEVVVFYESQERYVLHRPYVFVSATNPAAVDAACVPLRAEFARPI